MAAPREFLAWFSNNAVNNNKNNHKRVSDSIEVWHNNKTRAESNQTATVVNHDDVDPVTCDSEYPSRNYLYTEATNQTTPKWLITICLSRNGFFLIYFIFRCVEQKSAIDFRLIGEQQKAVSNALCFHFLSTFDSRAAHLNFIFCFFSICFFFVLVYIDAASIADWRMNMHLRDTLFDSVARSTRSTVTITYVLCWREWGAY